MRTQALRFHAVILQRMGQAAIAATRQLGDPLFHALPRFGAERQAEALVERGDGGHGGSHQVTEPQMRHAFLGEQALRIGAKHPLGPLEPVAGDLPADRQPVQPRGEGTPQDRRQPGDGGQHLERIAMEEDDPRIRIDRRQCLQREDVVRAFQHPAPRRPSVC